jgi:hypothetical protein
MTKLLLAPHREERARERWGMGAFWQVVQYFFYEACMLRGVEDQPGHVVVDEPEDHAEGDAAGEEEEGAAVARLVLLRRVHVTTIKTPNPKCRLFLKMDL